MRRDAGDDAERDGDEQVERLEPVVGERGQAFVGGALYALLPGTRNELTLS